MEGNSGHHGGSFCRSIVNSCGMVAGCHSRVICNSWRCKGDRWSSGTAGIERDVVFKSLQRMARFWNGSLISCTKIGRDWKTSFREIFKFLVRRSKLTQITEFLHRVIWILHFLKIKRYRRKKMVEDRLKERDGVLQKAERREKFLGKCHRVK